MGDEVLPKSKRRYIIGEDDLLVGGGREMIYKEYKSMSGYDCGDSNDCLQADGSGYFIIKASEFEQATCTKVSHATFSSTAALQDGALLCDFANGSQKWAMKIGFDWLASAATADGFVVPEVGDEIPCEASCTAELPDMCAWNGGGNSDGGEHSQRPCIRISREMAQKFRARVCH